MRKFSILAVLALVLLFSACGKEKKEQDAKTGTSEQPAAEANSESEKAAIAAAIAVAEQAAFDAENDYGCPSKAKVLKSITLGDDTRKFKYDDKNRIIRIGNYQLVYNGDELVAIGPMPITAYDPMTFERTDSVIVVFKPGPERDSITLNKDGFISSIMPEDAPSGVGYQFVDGNLTGVYSDAGSTEYKYDDKKSPFNCNTPKWVIQYLGGILNYRTDFASKNNIIEEKYTYFDSESENYQHSYKYEYDSDGFPIKQMLGSEIMASFEYCN